MYTLELHLQTQKFTRYHIGIIYFVTHQPKTALGRFVFEVS